MSRKIIFVYNAKAGFMHGIKDLIHKTAKPNTYPCKLCMITFTGATMDKLWKNYVKNLGIPTVFLHRDEFAASHPEYTVSLPAVLIEENKVLTTLIDSSDFNKINDINSLMTTLSNKLDKR